MNKITLTIDGQKYLILFSDVVLQVYELIGEEKAGKLVFSSVEDNDN